MERHVLARGEIEVRDSDHLLSVDVEGYIEVVRIAPAVVSDGGVDRVVCADNGAGWGGEVGYVEVWREDQAEECVVRKHVIDFAPPSSAYGMYSNSTTVHVRKD